MNQMNSRDGLKAHWRVIYQACLIPLLALLAFSLVFAMDASIDSKAGALDAAKKIMAPSVVTGPLISELPWEASSTALGTDPILRAIGMPTHRVAWVVKIDTLSVLFEAGNLPRDTSCTFSSAIVLDSLSGQTLRVDLLNINWESASNTEQYPESTYVGQLEAVGEVIHGLPESPPKIGLYAALQACEYLPLVSKKIYAHYVLYSRDSSDIVEAWIFDMYGAAAMTGHRGYSNNSFHHTVIDATTGATLCRYTLAIADKN